MRIFKSICALTALASLLMSMAPQPGFCQMSRKSVVSCAMPCCNRPAQAPACPMVRPAAPRDVIGVSSVKVASPLHVIATLAFRGFVPSVTRRPVFNSREKIPKIDVCSTPQSVPAPPVLA
ncbi:MAG: hypothetical protein A2992_08225 [Elusimicrobia bacterium RIFCSPLOWO2_01_FULL_59_12]|nr:MAG: hypothetical protein A2992_08225 [Elusimicrobia bacterium RIFCSPLOWO2_01_FULL_59_12]